MNEPSLFAQVLDIPDSAERVAFLDRACGPDSELRERLDRLLARHRDAGNFLEQPVFPANVTASFTPNHNGNGTCDIGEMIGPYKLLELIGEGGMGVVYVAEQTAPVRRRVALKVIKPGMDSREVVGRFEAERQALALMDHPNIAKVLDGGTTSSGRPYFVMELVRGLQITDYCDQAKLSAERRLRLFAKVCRAVQHAHQKGVIHRDIKPSNVLVTLHDGEPEPMVIDFGVAKAVNQRLTEKTIYTRLAQVLGTPLYMSPEQAELSALDVDTRADVYSLGVLLYELLTGTTPFDSKILHNAGFDEMRRIIREDEPPRPSQRVSTLGAQARSTVSERRGLDERRLSRLLRGDLDWVVMKALEKDRNRRYESAGAFANDVERYLADEPIAARPPSTIYRMRKFARRNKVAVVMATVLGLAALSVIGSVGWGIKDRAVRQSAAEAAAAAAMTESAEHYYADRLEAALAAAKMAIDILDGIPGMDEPRAKARERLADLEMVAHLADIQLRAMSSEWDDPFDWRQGEGRRAEETYGQAFREFGIDVLRLPPDAAAEKIRARFIYKDLVAALDAWIGVLQKEEPAMVNRVLAVARAADPDDVWRNRFRDAMVSKLRDQVTLQELAASVSIDSVTPLQVSRLGSALCLFGAREQAIKLLLQAQQLYPGDFWINHSLAKAFADLQPPRLDEAIRFYTAALAIRPNSLGVHLHLGKALDGKGYHDEAIAAYRMAIRIQPNNAEAYHNLGMIYANQKKWDEAIVELRLAISRESSSRTHTSLGRVLLQMGKVDEGIREFQEVIRMDSGAVGFFEAHHSLGTLLAKNGETALAINEYRKAISYKPENLRAHLNLAISLDNINSWDESIAECHTVIQLKSDFVEAYRILASVCTNKGDFAGAIKAWRDAIRIKPDYDRALNNFAWFLATCQDVKVRNPEEAVRLATRAIELSPNQAVYLNTLGVSQYRNGKWTASIDTLNKSAKLNKGGDSFDDFFLAMAHWRLGDKEQATLWFVKAVHWMNEHSPKDRELILFRAEAAELLGIAGSIPKLNPTP